MQNIHEVPVMKQMLSILLLSLVSVAAYSQPINREQAAQLMSQCQQERARNIAPLKEQAIEDCVNRRVSDRETCERRNRNFGERSNVGAATGMFWDLPVCQQALEAEQFFKRNPGAKEYNGS